MEKLIGTFKTCAPAINTLVFMFFFMNGEYLHSLYSLGIGLTVIFVFSYLVSRSSKKQQVFSKEKTV